MAISRFTSSLSALLLLSSSLVNAATRTYNMNVTWLTANPDNAFDRPTIGVNGVWPPPIIEADKGDRIVINLNNQLGNQSTTLHFHGLYQNGTTYMDGPMQVSQCGVATGDSITYNFTIDQPGTYWYHSHAKGQYPDGLRAPLIIHDPDFPYADEYDEEIILSVSDWYHDQMQELIPKFIDKSNPTGAEPVPNAVLFNDTQNLTIPFEAGKTYLFRMVNIGAFAGQYIWFEGHNMTIVEVDGIYTEPAVAEMIYLSVAQRCSFLITAKNDTTANYAFSTSMDTSLFDTLPSDLQYNQTSWLVYDSDNELPAAATIDDLDALTFDDLTLVPYDKLELYGEPDQQIVLEVFMDNLDDGANYAFFNNITYVSPVVPTLYTVMSAGDNATDATVYGEYTHSFVLEKGKIIEIVVNNGDTGKHPFHLHGHAFQAIWRSDEDVGFFNATADTDFPKYPMRRDTLVLQPSGAIVMRFVADNPGVWLFHCHIEWHLDSGLIATMVEAPLDIQANQVIPQDHIDACKTIGTPYVGNAAGNTEDYLDLTGQNAAPGPLPAGFTTKGIVAMAFSVLAALLGLATIIWYGTLEMKNL